MNDWFLCKIKYLADIGYCKNIFLSKMNNLLIQASKKTQIET